MVRKPRLQAGIALGCLPMRRRNWPFRTWIRRSSRRQDRTITARCCQLMAVVAATLVACTGTVPPQVPLDAGVQQSLADAVGNVDTVLAGPTETKVESQAICLQSVPAIALDFGAVMVGANKTMVREVRNCGTADIVLDEVALSPQAKNGRFGLSLDPEPIGGVPTLVLPAGITLKPAQKQPLWVSFEALQPTLEIPPVAETASIHFASGGLELLVVDVEAVSADHLCPMAAIAVLQGEKVPVGTTVHLSAAGSYAADGKPLAAYTWSLAVPTGSKSGVALGAKPWEATFKVDAQGTFTACVSVMDKAGKLSCDSDCRQVLATSSL